jgi:hypothetical protein
LGIGRETIRDPHENQPGDKKGHLLAFVKPSFGLERRLPPYHQGSAATGRNPWQRFWLVLGVFGACSFATGCHWLRPLRSILSAQIRDEKTDLAALESPTERVTTFHVERGSNCSSRSGRKSAQARGRWRTSAGEERTTKPSCRRRNRQPVRSSGGRVEATTELEWAA